MRSVSSPTTVTHLAGHSISAVIAVYNQAVGITPWAGGLTHCIPSMSVNFNLT